MNSLLRPALLFNAGFSLASGLVIALAPGAVGGWLGIDADGWLRLVGIVLLAHAAMIGALLGRVEVRQLARLNLAAIAPYPLLIIVLVATGVIDRPLGQGLALTDGALIAAVATAHIAGLRNPAPAHQPRHA